MNIIVREKRKITFGRKVITPGVIRRVAALFEREAAVIEDVENYFLNFSMDALDDSSYESKNAGIFELPSITELKAFQRIRLQFQTLSSSKNIEVQFYHTSDEDRTNNFVIVGGENSVWVNGILSQLSEIINSAQEQASKRWLFSNAALITWVLFNVVYFRLFWPWMDGLKNGWLALLFIAVVPIGSIRLFNYLQDYLNALWPDIEIQSISTHHNSAEARRKKAAAIVTLVLLPIIVGYIYDGLKNLFHLF